tara:strand:+ start:1270 stop:1449 length:180 start_codon:yes stop_codon:yes gene_type:complete
MRKGNTASEKQNVTATESTRINYKKERKTPPNTRKRMMKVYKKEKKKTPSNTRKHTMKV